MKKNQLKCLAIGFLLITNFKVFSQIKKLEGTQPPTDAIMITGTGTWVGAGEEKNAAGLSSDRKNIMVGLDDIYNELIENMYQNLKNIYKDQMPIKSFNDIFKSAAVKKRLKTAIYKSLADDSYRTSSSGNNAQKILLKKEPTTVELKMMEVLSGTYPISTAVVKHYSYDELLNLKNDVYMEIVFDPRIICISNELGTSKLGTSTGIGAQLGASDPTQTISGSVEFNHSFSTEEEIPKYSAKIWIPVYFSIFVGDTKVVANMPSFTRQFRVLTYARSSGSLTKCN